MSNPPGAETGGYPVGGPRVTHTEYDGPTMLDAKEVDDDGVGAAAVYLAWESEEDGTRIRHEHAGGEYTDLHLPNPRRHGALIIRDAADQWVNAEGTLTLDEEARPGVAVNVLVDAVGQPTACVQADAAALSFCWGPDTGSINIFTAPVYSLDGSTVRLGIGVQVCNEYCPETDNETILERFRRWSGSEGNPSASAAESGIPDTLKELLKGSGTSDGYRPGSTILPGVLRPLPKPEHIGPDFSGVRQPGSAGAKPGPTVSGGSGTSGANTSGDPFGSDVKEGRDTSAPSSPWPGSGTDWVDPDPFGWLHRPHGAHGPESPHGPSIKVGRPERLPLPALPSLPYIHPWPVGTGAEIDVVGIGRGWVHGGHGGVTSRSRGGSRGGQVDAGGGPDFEHTKSGVTIGTGVSIHSDKRDATPWPYGDSHTDGYGGYIRIRIKWGGRHHDASRSWD